MLLACAAAFLAALLVLVVPGLPLVLALRLRPLTSLAMLAPASVTVVTVSAQAAHLLGVRWSLLVPLLGGLVAGALALALGRMLRGLGARRRAGSSPRRADDEGTATPTGATAVGSAGAVEATGSTAAPPAPARGRTLALVLGLGLGGTAIVVRALHGMGDPAAITQTYDGIFHLNAVRAILDAQDASPGTVSTVNLPAGERGYYPAAWHQLASLVVMASGQSIPLASNALMLVVAAAVWPLGILALVATCTRTGPVGLFAAGALTGTAFAFPLALMTWGLLLPNFLSTALLPLVVLVAAHALGLAPPGRGRLAARSLVVLVPVVALAVVAAHPQGLHAALVLTLPMALWAAIAGIAGIPDRLGSGRRTRPIALPLGALVVLLGAVPVAWLHLRPTRGASSWAPHSDIATALAAGLGMSGQRVLPALLPAVLVGLAVLVVAARSRARWMLPPLAASVGLYVVAAAVTDRELRYLLTGPWYTDAFRLAAIIPVLAIPVLALGFDAAGSAVRGRAILARLVVAVPVLALLAGAVLGPAARDQNALMGTYWRQPNAVSADERALLTHAATVVPADARIIADPWTGGSLVWALGDRQVVAPTPGSALDADDRLLLRDLGRIGSDPAVCDAAARENARYVFTSGERNLWHRRSANHGPADAVRAGAATQVAQVGPASLWRLDPCRGTDGELELTGNG
jgi:hypothetical protein